MLAHIFQECSRREVKLISIDIFDTLIFRAAGEVEDLFALVAQTARDNGLLIDDDDTAFVQLRMLAEQKARAQAWANRGSKEVLLAEIYEQIPYFDSIAWCQLEIDVEVNSWQVNYPLVETLMSIQSTGKEIVLLSDMYLPSAVITEFWRNNCPDFYFSKVIVSAEIGDSKVEGGAFRYLADKTGLLPIDMLHIGDDLIADVQAPTANGLSAFHYDVSEYLKQINYFEKVICSQVVPGLQSLRKSLAASDSAANAPNYYTFGAWVYGPTLVAFARWVIQVCRKQRVKKLFCFLREGGIISEIVQKLCPDLDVRTLAVSRRSSFLPGLKTLDANTLFKLTNRRGYLLSEFAQDIGLILPKNLVQFAGQTLGNLAAHTLWRDIVSWVDSNTDKIESYLQEQNRLLIKYLRSQGVENGESQGFLDWGCGGTLSDTVCQVLNIERSHHFLFFSKESAHTLGFNGPLHCFQLASLSPLAKALSASPELSEVMLNQTLVSTRAYSENASKVIPVPSDSQVINTNNLKCLRKGVFDCLDVAIRQNWLSGSIDTRARERIFAILYRFVEYPFEDEANVLKALGLPQVEGKNHKLLPDHDVNKLARRSPEQNWKAYLQGNDPDINKACWFNGLMARAFPGFLQTQGHFFRLFNDEVVLITLLQKVREANLKEVVVYGAGELGTRLTKRLCDININVPYVIDRRAISYPLQVNGLPVLSLNDAKLDEKITIVIASRAFAEEIYFALIQQFPKLVDNIIRID